jgi:hypothetical protein
MSGLLYLLWYFPICIVALLVFQACKHDDPKVILRRAAKDFAVLTGVFVVGGLLLFLIHNLL